MDQELVCGLTDQPSANALPARRSAVWKDAFVPTDQPQSGSDRDVPTVSVRGLAAVRVEPDEAMLWITLSALEDSPGPALANVAAHSGQLVALLDELAIPKADRSTTGVRLLKTLITRRAGDARSAIAPWQAFRSDLAIPS
jgi:uncharacterized protein YggE